MVSSSLSLLLRHISATDMHGKLDSSSVIHSYPLIQIESLLTSLRDEHLRVPMSAIMFFDLTYFHDEVSENLLTSMHRFRTHCFRVRVSLDIQCSAIWLSVNLDRLLMRLVKSLSYYFSGMCVYHSSVTFGSRLRNAIWNVRR